MRGFAIAVACTLTCLSGCGNSDRPAPASPVNGPVAGAQCANRLPISGATEFVANYGRRLAPLGRQTVVGNYPSGGALTPDGKFYWAINSGHGRNNVSVVNVATGQVTQELPLPGGNAGVVFNREGTRAYVSGTKLGFDPGGPTQGDDGDVIHVYEIVPASGAITELEPFVLPVTLLGSGRLNSLPPDPTKPNLPSELALTPDGATLVVALNNADRVALIDTGTGAATTALVGSYPQGVAVERGGRYAFVSSLYDGEITRIDLNADALTGTLASAVATVASVLGPLDVVVGPLLGLVGVVDALGVGGPDGDTNSHPQVILADPARDRVYVAVTNHDGVAVVNTQDFTLEKFISLKRAEGFGTAPVALALHPDGETLYVADAGEDAIVSIALEARGSYQAFDVIGKLPTSFYPTDVEVTPDGCNLIWTAAKGINAGPNINYETDPNQYLPRMLIGKVGMLGLPSDEQFAAMTALVDQAVRPENRRAPPADTPLHGACDASGACAPSDAIKYVFYLVRENRTYDQLFGCDPRGDGACALELFGDNGKGGATGGVTPNAHAITREWVLLDRFLNNSEVSIDGHVITTGAYSTDRVTRTLHNNYSGRGAPYEHGLYPVSFPPKAFLFDQAARQNLSFRIYGERSGGTLAVSVVGGTGAVSALANRPTLAAVQANLDPLYPTNIQSGCLAGGLPLAPNLPLCTFDSGLGATPPLALSRIDIFNAQFQLQVATCNTQTIGTAACGVPQFNYLIAMNDHTNGTRPGDLTPKAMIADNDLMLGQLVQIISNSAIWPYSAIFVVEDDSQDGADHYDAHRSLSFVAGPYVKRGVATIHTRYDQLSVIRTIELILGMQPLSLYDAMATPLYNVFTPTSDNTPYTAVMPEQSITELNGPDAANAELSNVLPWNVPDLVPQSVADRLLWQSVHGADSEPPPPGPNASMAERARAVSAMEIFRAAKTPEEARRKLLGYLSEAEDD